MVRFMSNPQLPFSSYKDIDSVTKEYVLGVAGPLYGTIEDIPLMEINGYLIGLLEFERGEFQREYPIQ